MRSQPAAAGVLPLVRNHPLYKGLVFASYVGSVPGIAFGANTGSSLESVGLVRGVGFYNSRGRATWDNRTVTWNPTALGKGASPSPASVNSLLYGGDGTLNNLNTIQYPTLFCTMRKLTAVETTTNPFWGKVGVPDYTFGLERSFFLSVPDTGTAWRVGVCNSGGLFTLDAGVQQVNQDTTLAGTLDVDGLRLYQDGQLVGTRLAAFGPNGGNVQPYRAFSATSTNPVDCNMSVLLAWDRPLPQSAIAKLHSDPFTLWRPRPSPVMFNFMDAGTPGASSVNNFFCSF